MVIISYKIIYDKEEIQTVEYVELQYGKNKYWRTYS